MVDTIAAAPAPSAGGPVGDAQAVFRVALDAFARPGVIHQLPAPAPGAPGHPWPAALLLALLDHETPLWVAPGTEPASAPTGAGPRETGPETSLETYLRQRTGAPSAPLEVAAFALADATAPGEEPDGRASPEGIVRRLRRGTLAYPDEGATLVLTVLRLGEPEAPAGATVGTAPGGGPTAVALACTGPGVPAGAPQVLRVRGVRGEFVAAREDAVRDYPTGVDVFLVDGSGRLAGLPRSTQLEVLTRTPPEGESHGV